MLHYLNNISSMSKKIVEDTAQTGTEIISGTEPVGDNSTSIWFWIALIELFAIIYLMFFKNKKDTLSAKEKLKKESKKEKVDFDNIINSSFNVKPLYDELKVKCHPDRFPVDTEKNKIALDLFQEIVKNRTNYKKLIELKDIAKDKLKIDF